MVMTLRKRVPSISPAIEYESESETQTPPRKKKTQKNPQPRKTIQNSSSESEHDPDSEKENDSSLEYEKLREQRIRENRERMVKLGIFSLSSQIFNSTKNNQKVVRRKSVPQKRKRYPPLYPQPRDRSYDNARRSARLKDVPQAHYMETEQSLKDMGISIPDDWKPEVYTEEDEKLLGNCETEWTLNVDGFSEQGDRLYDPDGRPCHQCRQRVQGKLTFCGKCRSHQGQLCGDCLYIRYGENVLEVLKNCTWSCPSCRGICNCSRCRRTKGWQPINIQYSKVIESGFKSVAHYLILTRRAGAVPKDLNDEVEVVDLTAEETTAAPQHNDGSDYSAEWSESESDDSDSEDDSKGEKNEKEQSDENQVGSAVGSNEAAAADVAATDLVL